MQSLIGTSFPVFLGVTLFLFGAAAWLTGQAVAGTWRPAWQAVIYAAMLAAVDRFLIFALFEGDLLALVPYLFHAAVLIGIALVAYRMTRARRMVRQYPWLYEQAGPFGWRPVRRGATAPAEPPAQEELPP